MALVVMNLDAMTQCLLKISFPILLPSFLNYEKALPVHKNYNSIRAAMHSLITCRISNHCRAS